MDVWQKEVLFSVWPHRIMIGIDRAFQNKRVASFFVACGLPSVLLLLMDSGNVYSGGAQLYNKAYSVWSDYASLLEFPSVRNFDWEIPQIPAYTVYWMVALILAGLEWV